MPEYRIYRNNEVVLIRTPAGEIEISADAATALAAELAPKPRNHAPYTGKEAALLIKLYRDGDGVATIAHRLGRSRQSVNQYLLRNKIARHRPQGAQRQSVSVVAG